MPAITFYYAKIFLPCYGEPLAMLPTTFTSIDCVPVARSANKFTGVAQLY